MENLGIKLDKNKNEELLNEGIISSYDSNIPVFVVNVDEEIVIARETYSLIKNN